MVLGLADEASLGVRVIAVVAVAERVEPMFSVAYWLSPQARLFPTPLVHQTALFDLLTRLPL